MKALSEKLKHLRVSNNISQKALADTLGVTRSCLSNWENGLRTPHTKYIYEYMKIFDVPATYFDFVDREANPVYGNVCGLELSKLNCRGFKKLVEFYNELLSDEDNLRKKY